MSEDRKECQCPICGRSHWRLGAPVGNLANLARLNEYDCVGRALKSLVANGELSDYDDELANRVHDAIKIVRGICHLAGVPLQYDSGASAREAARPKRPKRTE